MDQKMKNWWYQKNMKPVWAAEQKMREDDKAFRQAMHAVEMKLPSTQHRLDQLERDFVANMKEIFDTVLGPNV